MDQYTYVYRLCMYIPTSITYIGSSIYLPNYHFYEAAEFKLNSNKLY